MTYRELKQELEKLTDKQLDQVARFAPDDEPFQDISGVRIFDEDWLYDTDEPCDGCAPRSVLEKEKEDLENYAIGIEKGTIALVEE